MRSFLPIALLFTHVALGQSSFPPATSGSGSGTVTSIATGCGTSGGAITVSGTIIAVGPVRTQTTTSDTFLDGDCGKLVTHSNGSAIAVSLPQANGSTFKAGWFVKVQNRGAGTVTITPVTSTIDGASSLTLLTSDGIEIHSDGTNYFTQRGRLRALVSGDVPNNAANTSGLASTATALANNGSNCLAGNYPLGVDASGNAESCTAAATGTVSGSGSADQIPYWTGAMTLGGIANSTIPDTSVRAVQTDSQGGTSSYFMGIGGDGFPAYVAALISGDLSYVHCLDTVCGSSQIITTFTGAGQPGHLLMGSDGFARIIYKTGATIHLIVCQDADCAMFVDTTAITVVAFPSFSSFYLNASDVATIAYGDSDTPNAVWVATCANAHCTSLSSTQSLAASDVATVMYVTESALGFPAILYTVGTSATDMDLIVCANQACTGSPTPITLLTATGTPNGGSYGNLHLGSDNKLRAITGQVPTGGGNGYISYALCGDASCSTHAMSILATTALNNVAPVVSFDVAGTIPYFVHQYDVDGSGVPIYTYSICQDATCTTVRDIQNLNTAIAYQVSLEVEDAAHVYWVLANHLTLGQPDLFYTSAGGVMVTAPALNGVSLVGVPSVAGQYYAFDGVNFVPHAGLPSDAPGALTNDGSGNLSWNTGVSTATNCSSSASPAVCAAAPAGSVAIPTGITSVALTVNTTAVTANSQIFLFSDDTLASKIGGGITCNSTLATLVGGMAVTARTAGTSFQVTYNGTIATNPLCVSYVIVN